MIRFLAVSLSAAALVAVSLPAAAQQRHDRPSIRKIGQPGIAARRLSAPRQGRGQRKFRSFNPPAPQITSGRRLPRSFNPPAPFGQSTTPPRAFSRGLAPPTPGGPVSPRSFNPSAPTGGQNFVGGPGSVPASLPPPALGQASPTAAPEQPAEARPQSDLQPPIPETIAAQPEPAAVAETEEKAEPEAVAKPTVDRHVCKTRIVYVPVYKERRIRRHVHFYVPHRRFRGHRHHFRAHFHRGFRRW